jgi:hypothetical protein
VTFPPGGITAEEAWQLGLPPPNRDEASVGPVVLPPLGIGDGADGLVAAQAGWRALFADLIYGPVPPPPDRIAIQRAPVPDEGFERVEIALTVGPRTFTVDAGLWLPPGRTGPVPIVAGLSFLGPAGVAPGDGFPLDPGAVVGGVATHGLVEGRLAEQIRGVHAYRWPVDLILRAGVGLLLTGYGSWTPDHPDGWRTHGVRPLLALADGPRRAGAISLWAWAALRLVDVAERLPEADAARVTLAGHSRLAKAALWAMANDPRPAAVLVNNAGCAGPAPSRRNLGETLVHMAGRFPHWGARDLRTVGARPEDLPIDQHQLVACVAPRRIHVASASENWWADPRGEYEGLRAAAPAWGITELPPARDVMIPGRSVDAGPLGWHLRPGVHEMMPWDWRRWLPFLNRP